MCVAQNVQHTQSRSMHPLKLKKPGYGVGRGGGGGLFLQSFSVDDDDTGICVRRGVRLPSKDILRLC